MKNISKFLWIVFLSTALFMGCEDNFKIEGNGIVKAPILRNIVLPDADNSNPGTDVTIQGKGFSEGDKVYLKNASGVIEVAVTAVAEGSLTFKMPENAGGVYSIEVERANLTTQLPGTISVPYLLVLKNIALPNGYFERGSIATIKADGFAEGDSVYFLSSVYPKSAIVKAKGTVSGKEFSFTIPSNAYGANTVIAVRWENGNARKGTLGTIGIKTNAGDEIGGGVVFYMIDEIHGLICPKSNITESAVQYGPACQNSVGTSSDIGAGKENTTKLLKQIADWRITGTGEWLTTKTVVELCNDFTITVNGLIYDDWFLPSVKELSELFKARGLVATKGAIFKNDGYWTSTEVFSGGWDWAQWWVNFYEPVNLVTGSNADRVVWKIGVIPIRSF